MKTHFVTYSDKNFENQRLVIVNYAKNWFDSSQGYTREWLETTEFYEKNKKILDNSKGAGFWLWKPFVILDKLNSIEDGDIIFYLDCADVFYDGFSEFLKNYFLTNDVDCLLTYGSKNKQKWYTKKDTFYLMDCDTEKYHEHLQLEAGIIVFKNTQKIREIVKEWLYYCTINNIITDTPNIHGENYDGFIKHQSDQSILSNLAIKYNLNMNNLSRNFVICNVNQ